MFFKAVFAGCFLAGAVYGAPYVWLDKPSSHNFNWNDKWPTMGGRKSISLKPNRPVPEKPFFEFEFECVSAGTYALWGRTFDPVWSSIGRWRINQEEWRAWTPEKRTDRAIYAKIQVLDWCRWGTVKLNAGKHKLRFEALDKRKRGDYHYFILDVLMLIQDPRFRPSGADSPSVQGQKLAELVRLESKHLESAEQRNEILSRVEKNMHIVESDTVGVIRLSNINRELRQRTTPVDDGSVKLLNGAFSQAKINGKNFSYRIVWNRPHIGYVQLLFTVNQSLYGSVRIASELNSTVLEGDCELPDLPNGTLSVYAVPLLEPSALSASVHIPVPEGLAKKQARASAYGIYRDSRGVLHPWHVTSSNVMIWDGEAYLPFGGMVNTRLSWISKPGTNDKNTFMERGERMLAAKLDFLRKNGIRDIYYNGFFLKGNPNQLRQVVELSEKKGMHYGLHIATLPEILDKGFTRDPLRTIPVPSGIRSVVVDPMSSFAAMPSSKRKRFTPPAIDFPCRALWGLTDANGKLADCGLVHSSQDKRFHISFKRITGSQFKLSYTPEMVIPARDPVGYLSGIETHCRRIRSIYGSLKLGPGLRFFVDPLNNEMHTRPLSIPVTPEFRKRNAQFLFELYGNAETLNQFWGTEATPLADLKTAARIVPVWSGSGESVWIDPENGNRYAAREKNAQALRDLKEFRGKICREMINRSSDALKEIADVPVVVKHNTWFSDWFVNDRLIGGYDGGCMESYCYGDSLAYHNSAVVYGEVMQSKRNQWCIVGESSAAAFEGQKNYCGYLDRLQMLHDVDQLMMLGTKGFYHFGFLYDPGANQFYTTDITRDPRQLEWLTTLAGIYRNAGERFLNYRPSYHGWFPAYLREREITNVLSRPFDIDGDYTGTAAKIRMAPDGRWILPALNPAASWKTLFSAEPLLNKRQRIQLQNTDGITPVKLNRNFDSFTANGIGIIPAAPGNPDRLQEFRRQYLGYEIFQTEELNGLAVENGKLLVWVCAERKKASLRLPAGASAWSMKGKKLEPNGTVLLMERPEHRKIKKDYPPHILSGYYFAEAGETECVEIRGTKKEAILKHNTPVMRRWLPSGVPMESVLCYREAEDFESSTFTQPSLVGYSRFSGNRAIGINTKDAPPAGKQYETIYSISLTKTCKSPVFWLRRMVRPALDLSVWVDGRNIGRISAGTQAADRMHLSPWNAGLLKNALSVGWYSIPLPVLSAGTHRIVLRAEGISAGYNPDTRLMGGEAQRFTGSPGVNSGMRAIQLDCFLIAAPTSGKVVK